MTTPSSNKSVGIVGLLIAGAQYVARKGVFVAFRAKFDKEGTIFDGYVDWDNPEYEHLMYEARKKKEQTSEHSRPQA